MADLISRQSAIDALVNKWDGMVTSVLDVIKELPSAEPEIIRCADCRWWDRYDDGVKGYCFAAKHGYFSEHWEIGIYRTYKGDFYCADAERRTDGSDRQTSSD